MKKYFLCIAIITTFLACNSEKRDYASSEHLNDTKNVESTLGSDTIATPKIIKTADMQFRVKDVQQTKAQLSKVITLAGGSVIEFAINSTIQETEKVKYTLDSLKQITSYRTEGLLVAKIPSEKLDEFTNTIAKLAVFVDHQSLKMDDQGIAYLANRLKAQNRVETLKAITKIPKKQGHNVESSMYIKDDYIDKKIENMYIDNRVQLSTITLNFYQDNTIKTLIISNDNLYDFRPGFFQRLWLNMVDGWVYFKEFILTISHLWMLAFIGFGVYFGTRYYIHQKKG